MVRICSFYSHKNECDMHAFLPSAKTTTIFHLLASEMNVCMGARFYATSCQMCYLPNMSSDLIIPFWKMPWHLQSHPVDMWITQILWALVLISLKHHNFRGLFQMKFFSHWNLRCLMQKWHSFIWLNNDCKGKEFLSETLCSMKS